jgi:hypothetical protein
MGPMRPAQINRITARLDVSVVVDLPDGTFAGINRAMVTTGGTVEDAAVSAARLIDADIRADIDRMVAVIEGGVNRDGDQLFMELGQPWNEEGYAGAVVDAHGCLWVQMDNWPGDQWLSPTGHGVREWRELAFPVKLASPTWPAALG